MIRGIASNSLVNICSGPISKPLDGSGHDIFGNLLAPATTRYAIQPSGTHGVIFFGSTIVAGVFTSTGGSLANGFNTFEIDGTTYTPTAMSVLYIQGVDSSHTTVSIATSENIWTDISSSSIIETMQIEFTGSGGTQVYSPSVGPSYDWQRGGSDKQIKLYLESGRSFGPWYANNANWGDAASNNQTDTTAVVTLII